MQSTTNAETLAEQIAREKELVIFDLDKTIATLSIDWVAYRPLIKEFIESTFGIELDGLTRADEMEAFTIEKKGLSAYRQLLERRIEYEAKADLSDSILNLQAIELIYQLRARKVSIAISSNNTFRTINRFLQQFGLEDIADYSVGVDTAGAPKPDPKGVQMILTHYKINPNQALFIGDNDSTDREAAEALNIDYRDVKEI